MKINFKYIYFALLMSIFLTNISLISNKRIIDYYNHKEIFYNCQIKKVEKMRNGRNLYLIKTNNKDTIMHINNYSTLDEYSTIEIVKRQLIKDNPSIYSNEYFDYLKFDSYYTLIWSMLGITYVLIFVTSILSVIFVDSVNKKAFHGFVFGLALIFFIFDMINL